MKKLIFLFVILLSGCKVCSLAQIPTQFIYMGQGCTAPIPDYLPRIHASDNCSLASLTQSPLPGFLLDTANIITRVTIKATDATGNSSQIQFDVMLIDTIPPIITADDTLITADYDKMEALYTQADNIVRSKILYADATFPYYKLGITNLQDTIFYVIREIKLK